MESKDKATETAEQLKAELARIPVTELAACARDNLTATRKVRLGKDQPEGIEEPDYVTRQKALEWISAVLGLSPTAQRKPVEPRPTQADKPDAGGLKRGKGNA